jgi:hypothetical protein
LVIFNAQQQVARYSYQDKVHKSELPPDIRVYIERIEQQQFGPQTNVNGTINGDVLAGLFQSAVAVGGGNAQDSRGESDCMPESPNPLWKKPSVFGCTRGAGCRYTSLTIPAYLKIDLEDQRNEVARLEAELKCT